MNHIRLKYHCENCRRKFTYNPKLCIRCKKPVTPIHFEDWFESNLIYCEDTHSFVHRLFKEIQRSKCTDSNEVQQMAITIVKEMENEYSKKFK